MTLSLTGVLRYGVALLVACVALLATSFIEPLRTHSTYLLPTAAVAVSAWYGGLGPGLLCSLGLAAVVPYLFIEPTHSIGTMAVDDLFRLSVFVLVSLLINSAGAMHARAEARSRESEARYRRLVELSPSLLFVQSEGRIVFINTAGAQLLGARHPEQIIGKAVLDMFHPDSHALVARRMLTLRERGATVPLIEEKLLRLDGTAVEVEATATALTYDDKPAVLVIAHDVSERKRIETMQARLAAIVESSDDAIIGQSLNGNVVSWNAGAERLFGYPANRMIGEPIARLIPPDRPDEEPQILERLRRGERIRHFDTVRLHTDGRLIDVSLTISPVRDEAGQVVGASEIAHDMTERKRAEREILELNTQLERRVAERTAQLEAANKELESFSYSVSHDLRAPLRSIDGFSQALLEDCRDRLDAQGRDHLHRVRAASQRMARLIDDLLNLSRVTRREIRQEPLDLSLLALAVVTDLQNAAPARRVEVVVEPGLRAEGDPQLLRVVLENLLGNAWKFTGTRGSPRIEVGMIREGDRPVYFVRDNGVGFDMAYADKLFGAFQRLHSLGEFEGTGIGLATVQRIIRSHGGRVWAESAVGQGATFYFTL